MTRTAVAAPADDGHDRLARAMRRLLHQRLDHEYLSWARRIKIGSDGRPFYDIPELDLRVWPGTGVASGGIGLYVSPPPMPKWPPITAIAGESGADRLIDPTPRRGVS